MNVSIIKFLPIIYEMNMEYLPNEKIMIHVSNFRSVKRVPDVVKSFAKIVRKDPC